MHNKQKHTNVFKNQKRSILISKKSKKRSIKNPHELVIKINKKIWNNSFLKKWINYHIFS